MSFLKSLGKAAASNDDAKTVILAGKVLKKVGVGIAAGAVAVGAKIKGDKKDEKKNEATEQPVPAPGASEPAATAPSTSASYTLADQPEKVRCPNCSAMVDPSVDKCPKCGCQIAGNSAARSGPL
jgi:hypothetical protein